MLEFLKKIVGSRNDRELKRLRPTVEKINDLEPEIDELSEEALREKTGEFRRRLEGGETVDDLLPEAFAAVRESSRRSTGMRPFDVQLIGAMVLHSGRIAEMKTGEGKTLVATLALYLNALEGKGAHLITVNDYLARRDVQWMGPIFHGLGMSTASILHDASFVYDPTHIVQDYRFQSLRPVTRREAYRADITYGTNNEFGFDYLRDNMKFSLDDYVQRELHFAIVDEVDNILIDEARTPLIISGPAEIATEKYYTVDRVIPKLRREADYTVEEKHKQVMLTDEGVSKVERTLGIQNLYDPNEIDTLHHVNQALRAHVMFKKDVDYVVKEGKVIIVDEFTGRLMPGRRWSDGLHQAVEAKEACRIERENQTLATITIQNYFRMYSKLSGMTGTADTESVEFKKIYDLEVVVIPPNKPMIREDLPDLVYRTEKEKLDAVVEDIRDCVERGQPVLVGTISVEKSEQLGKRLKREKIRHNVLNAVNHELEANVISQAGRAGAVTIATNMAGRGTDILLGGNPEFLARAEMEDEWIKKVAKLARPGAAPAKRFEDAVRDARDSYDEALERIREEYVPRLEDLDDKRKEALREELEARQQLLEESPWRDVRDRYERLASSELIPAVADGRSVTPGYFRIKKELEGTLDELSGGGAGGTLHQEFLSVRRELADMLETWNDPADRAAGNGLAERVNSKRVHYDRVRGDLEMQLLLSGGKSGDPDVALRALDAASRLQQIEKEYRALEEPYQKALAAAHDRYEKERQEYTSAVAEVREQLQKAPQEFEEHFAAKQEHYKGVCADERERVLEAGGLHIIGTERHESRRIDNQLRGRSGRQGDPGSSRFYLSLEDDLLRIFGAERIQGVMQRLGMEEGIPIEHGLINRSVSNAQGKVEGHNFDIRKHLLEYDDVMNQQREVIYTRRRDYLSRENLKEEILEIADRVAEDLVPAISSSEVPAAEWEWPGVEDAIQKAFNLRFEISDEERETLDAERLTDMVTEGFRALYEAKEAGVTPGVMRQLERMVVLDRLDAHWKEHLLSMDHLKEGIGLRGYGQKNPLHEYKKEGFNLFEAMMNRFEEEIVERLATVQVVAQQDGRMQVRKGSAEAGEVDSGYGAADGVKSTPHSVPEKPSEETLAMMRRLEERRQAQAAQARHVQQGPGRQPQPKSETIRRVAEKVGRNEPCPCGSGKKYKKCHGS